MKVIDKTPLQNEKGEIGPLERLQGTLKYGFSWYPELEAQKVIITQLDRALEKGFTLIRNLTLPGSDIIEPLILIGPPGVYVIYVTHLTGVYEARGDQWGTNNNGRFMPSSINLMSRAARLAKVLQVYIERQGVNLPKPVEAVLIASSPAMHIDSTRPLVRVLMSDAVKSFAVSLLQAPPLLRSEFVYDLADRIVTPRPKAAPQAPVVPAPQGDAQSPSRAQAIFHAAEDVKPFNPSDLEFKFDESAAPPETGVPQSVRETSPAQPLPQPAQKKSSGMKLWQWIFLVVMAVVECCVIGGFGFLLLFSNR